MRAVSYAPENLLPAYKKLFSLLGKELPEVFPQLKGRRAVARHGSCSKVLVWTIKDKRQMAATSDPNHFGYSFNYDPVRYESMDKDWVIKLHMNTTRIYHNAREVRDYLLREMPLACPKGFKILEHERYGRCGFRHQPVLPPQIAQRFLNREST